MSSVSGGWANEATNVDSSVSGGWENQATGKESSVSVVMATRQQGWIPGWREGLPITPNSKTPPSPVAMPTMLPADCPRSVAGRATMR